MGVLARNTEGYQLLAIKKIRERDLERYRPLKGAFFVIKQEKKFVLKWDKNRLSWRLLYTSVLPEELTTIQWNENVLIPVQQTAFSNLMMIKTPKGEVRHYPVYTAELANEFVYHDASFILWDGVQDIGYIDSIHHKLLEHFINLSNN